VDFKDYYATLGVPKTASAKEIKAAFRRLARKHHPDVNPGDTKAEGKFKDVNEAYEVLGDPEKRKKYDELGANWRMYEQAERAGGSTPGGSSPRWTWSPGSGGFRPMSEDEMSDMFGDQEEGPFSDFFKQFFGGAAGSSGRARSRRPRQAPGRDVEHSMELDLEDVLNGSVQRLSIRHDGNTRQVEVRIPPGVSDGSRVRVAGEGERGSGSAPHGDLYLRVHLRPHLRFERKGRDLYSKVKVPLTTAVLGGEVDVSSLNGKTLRLKVPPTTQNGQVFRLRGHGLPSVGKADDRGDLYATAEVALPSTLTPEAQRHFEALREIERDAKA
jgi:curved DNA-binding protein